jgi:hypothetical protein
MANSSFPAKSPTRSTDRGCNNLYQATGPRGPTWYPVVDDVMVCDVYNRPQWCRVVKGRLWKKGEKREILVWLVRVHGLGENMFACNARPNPVSTVLALFQRSPPVAYRSAAEVKAQSRGSLSILGKPVTILR